MSEAIHRNTRGENPAVPVGMISRFPMLDPVERYISNFHVYCAIVLMVVLYVNFAGPKGNGASADTDPATSGLYRRLASSPLPALPLLTQTSPDRHAPPQTVSC